MGGSLYLRLLRIRHLKPRPWVMFLLVEAPILGAVLLALAEIVNWWAVLVVPATVAVWLKFSDVIAGETYARPRAAAQLRRPRLRPRHWLGISQVPPRERD